MATIASQTNHARHARKTITFNGSSPGGVGTFDIFTITGRVIVENITAFATTGLTDAGGKTPATLNLGVSSAGALFAGLNPADDLDTDEWWDLSAGAAVAGYSYTPALDSIYAISEDIIGTIAEEAISGGVIVFDVWYKPVTDNGALAGDDIDSGKLIPDLQVQLTESYNSDGSTPTVEQALFVIMQTLTERSISSTTMTVKKLDGSTTALTLTLDDADNPTSLTRSG